MIPIKNFRNRGILLRVKIEYINYYTRILKDETQKDCGCRNIRSVFETKIVQLEKLFEPGNPK